MKKDEKKKLDFAYTSESTTSCRCTVLLPSSSSSFLSFSLSLTSLPFPLAKSTFFQLFLAISNTSKLSSYFLINLSTSFVHCSSSSSESSDNSTSTWRIPAKNAERICKLCIARRACADISWVCKRWWIYARVKWGLYRGVFLDLLSSDGVVVILSTPWNIRVDGDTGEHAAQEQMGRSTADDDDDAPRKAFESGLKSKLNFKSYKLWPISTRCCSPSFPRTGNWKSNAMPISAASWAQCASKRSIPIVDISLRISCGDLVELIKRSLVIGKTVREDSSKGVRRLVWDDDDDVVVVKSLPFFWWWCWASKDWRSGTRSNEYPTTPSSSFSRGLIASASGPYSFSKRFSANALRAGILVPPAMCTMIFSGESHFGLGWRRRLDNHADERSILFVSLFWEYGGSVKGVSEREKMISGWHARICERQSAGDNF